MKKIIFGLVIASVLMISSCTQTTTNPLGAWTFKSVSYNPLSCRADSSRLVANSSPNSLKLIFNNTGTLPAVSADFLVVDTIPAAGQVEVIATIGTSQYISTGGNGTQKITIELSDVDSKIRASTLAVELRNATMPTDSGKLSFAIVQQ